MEIKNVFFDFGGCLDAPGIHTRTIFWQAFSQGGLVALDKKPAFQDAFSFADQRMMTSGEARALGLREFNRHNAAIIAEKLNIATSEAVSAADWITDEMAGNLKQSLQLLQILSGRAQLGIISNFTGNLEVILKEFSLREFFGSVTESYYEGCAKPDPRIFISALRKKNQPAEKCLFIGDNPVNDIAPAKKLGFQTALIHLPGEKKECGADFYLEDLNQLLAIVKG